MKKITYILLFGAVATFSQTGNVGIGTDDPQTALDVNGSMLIQATPKIGALGTLGSSDNNYFYLTRRPDSNPPGEITYLDVSQLKVAPINVVNYTFNGLQGDNLTDVDPQYDKDKYIVALANFRHEGSYLNKSGASIGNFVTRVFESGSTWHLEIQNRILDVPTGRTITYHVTLIIYDRSYIRQLNPVQVDMDGLSTGAAANSPF